jgi:hypothetical protein
MATRYVIKEVLRFCIEYIQQVKFMKRRVWDDLEEPIVHNDVLEGNRCPCKLSVDLKSWAHTFVLHIMQQLNHGANEMSAFIVKSLIESKMILFL